MSLPRDKAWFPAKRYGYGWGLPSRWQGWVVMLVFFGALGCGVGLARSEPVAFARKSGRRFARMQQDYGIATQGFHRGFAEGNGARTIDDDFGHCASIGDLQRNMLFARQAQQARGSRKGIENLLQAARTDVGHREARLKGGLGGSLTHRMNG